MIGRQTGKIDMDIRRGTVWTNVLKESMGIRTAVK
jgi:hypothetical protein